MRLQKALSTLKLVEEFYNLINETLPTKKYNFWRSILEKERLEILPLGNTNVGKSTLMKEITGMNYFLSSNWQQTSYPWRFSHDSSLQHSFLVYELRGESEDNLRTENANSIDNEADFIKKIKTFKKDKNNARRMTNPYNKSIYLSETSKKNHL